MKKLTFKQMVILSVIIPLLLMLLLLAPIMTYQRVNEVENHIENLGQSVGALLVGASADALITRDDYVLKGIVKEVVSKEEIVVVKINDMDAEPFLFAENSNLSTRKRITTIRMAFPIFSYVPNINSEIELSGRTSLETIQRGEQIGELVILMNGSLMAAQVHRIYGTSLIIALVVLSISAGIGGMLGRLITRPIKYIAEAVKLLSGGDYQRHKPLAVINKDFKELTDNINNLAENLADAKQRQIAHVSELSLAQRQAERANNSKTEFLANMSHELRSPLHTIRGMLQLTLDQLPEGSLQAHQLHLAFSQSEILLADVDELMDIAQIEIGVTQLNAEYFSLTELMNTLFELYRPLADEKSLELVFGLNTGLEGDEQIEIFTDQHRLQKIITNLITNAIKYSSGGKITVDLTLIRQVEKLEVFIAVSDTGIGIAQENLKNIFNMFHQVDNSNKRRYEGKGLGLAIAKQYSELLGGEIHVKSKLHEGSTFTVLLPLPYRINLRKNLSVSSGLADAIGFAGTNNNGGIINHSGNDNSNSHANGESVDDNKSANNVGPIEGGLVKNSEVDDGLPRKVELSKIKVLLVEDNIGHQMVLDAFLKEKGVQLEIANNGVEGLSLFQKKPFDLVIIDCFMPEVNGFELAKQIRLSSSRHVPLLGMSADAKGETMLDALVAGMDDFIPKPPQDLNDVLEKIIRLVKGKSSVDAVIGSLSASNQNRSDTKDDKPD